jgi:hypothetical protein
MGGRPARARGGGSGAGGGGLRLRAAQPTQAATKEAFPVMMHVLEPEVVSVPVLTDARVGMVGLEVEQEGEAVGGGGLGLAVLLALSARPRTPSPRPPPPLTPSETSPPEPPWWRTQRTP